LALCWHTKLFEKKDNCNSLDVMLMATGKVKEKGIETETETETETERDCGWVLRQQSTHKWFSCGGKRNVANKQVECGLPAIVPAIVPEMPHKWELEVEGSWQGSREVGAGKQATVVNAMCEASTMSHDRSRQHTDSYWNPSAPSTTNSFSSLTLTRVAPLISCSNGVSTGPARHQLASCLVPKTATSPQLACNWRQCLFSFFSTLWYATLNPFCPVKMLQEIKQKL